jgi:hypothetical protein
MADNKTKATAASVQAHIQAKANAKQLADCMQLLALLEQITQSQPLMWGPSIIGYGCYHYQYESGRKGTAPLTGFAIRGAELVLYLACDWPQAPELLAQLGKHKMGKACLYIKRLEDVDLSVLAALVEGSVAELQRRYPGIS